MAVIRLKQVQRFILAKKEIGVRGTLIRYAKINTNYVLVFRLRQKPNKFQGRKSNVGFPANAIF